MVRGGEVLNDATKEDAVYVGMDQVAEVVSNGKPVPGTVYELLSEEAKELLDHADVILSKGQGSMNPYPIREDIFSLPSYVNVINLQSDLGFRN